MPEVRASKETPAESAPEESVFDESAFRQHEAEAAVDGDNTDAQEISRKRAAALGLTTAAPTSRRSKADGDETAAPKKK